MPVIKIFRFFFHFFGLFDGFSSSSQPLSLCLESGTRKVRLVIVYLLVAQRHS